MHIHPKDWMDEIGMKLKIEKVWECHTGGCLKG